MRLALGLAIALVGPCAAQAERTSDAAAVERLISKIYEGYKAGGDPEKSTKALPFDDSLVALIAKVEEVNSEGVGFDPFCACQDWENIQATVKVSEVTPQTATVVANVVNLGDKVTITYQLVNTPKGWRIHDMVLPEAPSFRQLMIEGAKP